MAHSPTVAFRWPQELIDAIDGARGDVSRARYVRRVVEQHLDASRAGKAERFRQTSARHAEAIADVLAEPIPGQMTVDDVMADHDRAIADVDPVLKEPPRAWLGEPSDVTTPEDVIEDRRAGTVRICPQCGDGAVGSDWICVECGYKLAPHER